MLGPRRQAVSPPAAVDLAHRCDGDGPPVLLLHGLFGSKRNWRGVAKALAPRHRACAPDLRNHGESPWTEAMDYAAMAADLDRLIGRHGLGPCAVLGHSMGGKAAMMLALTRPDRVGRLIVVDIAPARSPAESAARAAALADLPLAACDSRADADARLAEASPDPRVRGFLLQNLVRDAAGRLAWRVNLAALDRHADGLAGFPAIAGTYAGPTLFLGGGDSPYLRADHAPIIRRLFPNAEIDRLPDAGHWVHVDKPEAFVARVRRFLEARA